MTERNKNSRISLSTLILTGMVMGILCGIFFGEYCKPLQIIGNGFIKLLQMTILPYITVSLISGIGRLTFEQAKLLAIKAGGLLVVFWAISIVIVLLLPLSFPEWESAAFFSSSLVETPKKVDFLDLYIPSNPFNSLANNVVPAVVLFSILLGVALIGITEKQELLRVLNTISDGLVKVTNLVVQLTPIGVFAISASAAGTMTIEQFGKLQVYLISFNAAALLLTFGVLPLMVLSLTPFKYKDVVGMSKDALVTAFTTGNLFVVLPVLTANCKKLFEKYELKHEKTDVYIDVTIPVSFNFPNTGKLLMLLFILFAAWFSGNTFSLSQYPMFAFSGLLSFFGGVDVAMPFMLDLMEIPADLYQLYLVTGVINGRTATLLGAMNLLVFTVLATSSLTGTMSFKVHKFTITAVASLLMIIATLGGSRIYFTMAVKNVYEKDKVITSMQAAVIPASGTIYTEISEEQTPAPSRLTVLDRIKKRGILRVGYHPDNLPFSYFNSADDLVGFDVDMASLLADDLGVNVEFIPFKFETLADQLESNHFDIAMSGIELTVDRLERMKISIPYMRSTLAFIVPDHLRDEFANRTAVGETEGLKIGVPRLEYTAKKLKRYHADIEAVLLESPRVFFEREHDLDACLMTAEQGAAWTLLYPKYQVVVPKPNVVSVSLGYAIRKHDPEMAEFIDQWIRIKQQERQFQKIYDHWILGLGADEKEPRWSVIRDVLHWVE